MSNLLRIPTISFPYFLVFIFPLLIALFFLTRRSNSRAVAIASVSGLSKLAPSTRQLLRIPVLIGLGCATVLFLTVAAARPQLIDTLHEPYDGRNLMLALDISKSMATGDFGGRYGRANRLQAVKAVVSEFIGGRSGDRIGVVVFGTHAFLQSPLTLDHTLVRDLVEKLRVGLAGDGTAIGDGLGLSLKRVQGSEGRSKAVILLTDGVSNSGQVNPLQAAKVARDLDIVVHTVGIGRKGGSPGRFGNILTPGYRAGPEFDEKTLKSIAEITGGVYFHASDIEGLKKVYAQIDLLEKSTSEEPKKQKVTERFVPYAITALCAYLLLLLFGRTVFLKVP